MSPERFEQLIAAYGADPARWPPAERAAAQVHAEQDNGALQAERALDDALDAWRTAPMSVALREQILVAAPRPQRAGWSWRRLWLPGAGLAAVCAAGAAFGVVLVGASVAGAFPISHGEGVLSDGVKVFGSSLDEGAVR